MQSTFMIYQDTEQIFYLSYIFIYISSLSLYHLLIRRWSLSASQNLYKEVSVNKTKIFDVAKLGLLYYNTGNTFIAL